MQKEHFHVIGVWAIVFLLLAIMLSALIAVDPLDQNDLPVDEDDLIVGEYNDEARSFSSDQELKEFIDDSRRVYNDRGLDVSGPGTTGAETLTATGDAFGASQSVGSTEYSETNIQVEGVDEPDIVKTDGRYLYVLTGYEVVILKAYPGINAQVVSRIELDYYGHGLFLAGSKLVVLSTFYNRYYSPVYSILEEWCYPYFYGTSLLVYDISSRWSPKLVQNVTVEGYYLDARLIDNHVYMVTSTYMWYWYYDDGIHLPVILYDGVERQIYASDIHYWSGSAYRYTFTTIVSVNLQDKAVNQKIYLTDANHEMYVSRDYLYLAKHHYVAVSTREWPRQTTWFPNTVIHKIAIDDGRISYHASGIVPGFILNQFSMDEHNGYFRIATTTGIWWGEDAKNNVYVLNKNMETVGRLEGLAPGETIYAARFLGDRCYLVTFLRVDSFFVIDLRNPTAPRVLGNLKIPGFSTYLHPYDENHVIGVGMSANDQENFFEWFEGVKMSLFDVTNVYRPKEVAKIEIGDRGTYSNALYDHKAFLFDRSKDLLIIPVQLHEVDESSYPGEVPPNAWGQFVMQGAFVFSLTIEDGFDHKGTISHGDEVEPDPYHYYYWGSSYVRRSLYIEDNIYTISNEMVKINDMDTIDEIKAIEL